MEIPNSITKLINITKTELNNDFYNRAVFGGVDKYNNQWLLEAHVDQIPETLIEVISNFLLNIFQFRHFRAEDNSE